MGKSLVFGTDNRIDTQVAFDRRPGISIGVCEDNSANLRILIHQLKLISSRDHLAFSIVLYRSRNELGIAMRTSTTPDILVVDTLFDGSDGIDLGVFLRNHGFDGDIVYVSDGTEDAPRAFEVHAFGYVLKKDETTDCFEHAIASAYEDVRKRKRHYVIFNGISERLNLPIDEILYFEVRNHICVMHYRNSGGDGEFEFISSLQRIENELISYGFLRTYRYYVVNCSMVRNYSYKQIVLDDGTQLPVGRRYYSNLKQVMEGMSAVMLGGSDDVQE